MVREVEEATRAASPQEISPSPSPSPVPAMTTGSPISGILKGGKLWKQQSQDVTNGAQQLLGMIKANDNAQVHTRKEITLTVGFVRSLSSQNINCHKINSYLYTQLFEFQ